MRPVRYSAAFCGIALLTLTSCAGTGGAAETADPGVATQTTGADTESEPADGARVFTPTESDPSKMTRAWARWRDLDEHDYDTRVTQSCFCPVLPATVTQVRDDRIVSVTQGRATHHRPHRSGWTMDRLFFMLRDAYAQADVVSVKFGRDGVPRTVSIDTDTNMADEEQYLAVTLMRR